MKIELNDSDEELLFKVVKAMDYDYKPLRYSYKCNYKDGTSVMSHTSRVNITNKVMVESLLRYGIVPNKSNVLDMDLDMIPQHLFRHFLRGYWDGDGHIQRHPSAQMSLVGTRMMIEKFIVRLQQVMPNLVYTTYCRHPNNPVNVTLCICRKKQCEDLLHYLYDDAQIYMERKYNEFLKFL